MVTATVESLGFPTSCRDSIARTLRVSNDRPVATHATVGSSTHWCDRTDFKSLCDVLEWTQQAFQPAMAIAENAYRSARSFTKRFPMWNRHTQLVLVRDMLTDLGQKLAPLFLDPGRYGDLESAFNDQSRFKLAMSEGRTTKGNKKLMAKRVLTYAGQRSTA